MRHVSFRWDQGEADAKRTNSTWYAQEFPKLIQGWRDAFDTPGLPFIYVELCTEYGAHEPKEHDFYMAQRTALSLPQTGFVTTTDIQRALHPPNKQKVADRLILELQRLTGIAPFTISRGPELMSTSYAGGKLSIVFSNQSLSIRQGIQVPPPADGCRLIATDNGPLQNSAVMQVVRHANGTAERAEIPFTLSGNRLIVTCSPGNESTPVLVNSDSAQCFVYGPSNLPAPPLSLPCRGAGIE